MMGVVLYISCNNKQTSDETEIGIDSVSQPKIAGLENAILLKQIEDGAYYLTEDDFGTNCVVKYTRNGNKVDTVFCPEMLDKLYNYRLDCVSNYKVVKQGILLETIKDECHAENPLYFLHAVFFLRIPTDEVREIVSDVCSVKFEDAYMSAFRYFIANLYDINRDDLYDGLYDADGCIKFEYDSLLFVISYSELTRNLSKVIEAKNKEYENYEHKSIQEWRDKHKKINNLDWLNGRWVNGSSAIEINTINMHLVAVMNHETIYRGNFAIENGRIVYDRQRGYYSYLDIDNKDKRIGDSKAGFWFRKSY